MKKFAIILIVFLLIFSLCSCDIGFDSENIMSPPNPTGDQADIQKLVSAQSSNNYELVYPLSGDNKNSIITKDLDDDGTDEAFAFYKDKSDKTIHVLFISKSTGKYQVIDNVKTDAQAIDKIDFCDVDADSIKEVVIGYSYSTSFNKLCAYRFTDTLVSSIYGDFTYTSFLTGDFDTNKTDDILLITLYTTALSATSALITYSDDSLVSSKECEIDADLTKIVNAKFGLIDNSTYGAVIDGINNTNEYSTQVVYFDKEASTLKNPLVTYQGYAQTKRNEEIYSQDIDNDKIIEIPVCNRMEAHSDENKSSVALQTSWTYFDAEEQNLIPKKTVIMCQNDGYMFTMPNTWLDCVTARYDQVSREMTVYVWEYINGQLQTTDTLLVLKVFNRNDYENGKDGFIEITSTPSITYAYQIPENENYLLITGEEVVNNFSLVSNK